jgi:Spy/CpxP family protein refolding chaperone
MFRASAPYLLFVSLAINVPFVLMWANSHLLANKIENATAPIANKRSFGRPPSGPFSPEQFMRSIGIDDEQWEKMEERQLTFHRLLRETMEQSCTAKTEMLELFAHDEVDRDLIQEKQDEFIDTQKRMQDLMVENLMADKKDLKADQFERLHKMIMQTSKAPPFSSGKGVSQH